MEQAGGAFATSGAFAPLLGSLTPDGLGDPVEAGRGGLVVVDRVAASPDRPLLAVGYNNGLVCLNKIGTREEMMLRPPGAAVTVLAWSPDGTHLAFGDAEGEATLVAFPARPLQVINRRTACLPEPRLTPRRKARTPSSASSPTCRRR